jgi:hypothetical protein
MGEPPNYLGASVHATQTPIRQAPRVDVVNAARWVGVAIAILGVIVGTPEAAMMIGRVTIRAIGEAVRWVGRRIIDVWSRLRGRRSVTVQVGPAALGFGGVLGTAKITASGRVWPSSGTDADKIEALHALAEQLETQIRDLRNDHAARLDNLAAQLNDANTEHRNVVAAHREEHRRAKRTAVEIDARGIPVIGAGIVLTRLPDYALEWWGDAFGWAVIAISVAVTFAMVFGAENARRKIV